MLLEQCGALLHLNFDRSSGPGNCPQHILPADNHADDIDDWNHCLGALPALPRSPVAAHAGKAEFALSLQHCVPCLPLQKTAMTPIWTQASNDASRFVGVLHHLDHADVCPGSKRQRSA